MPHTSMIAKIKKIDITNKIGGENWGQTISITLSDIEMNDENLIAIRKFKPKEEVRVHFNTLQLTREEMVERQKKEALQQMKKDSLQNTSPQEEDSPKIEEVLEEEGLHQTNEPEVLFQVDYDKGPPDPRTIVKVFDFSK